MRGRREEPDRKVEPWCIESIRSRAAGPVVAYGNRVRRPWRAGPLLRHAEVLVHVGSVPIQGHHGCPLPERSISGAACDLFPADFVRIHTNTYEFALKRIIINTNTFEHWSTGIHTTSRAHTFLGI